jgi:protein phosphatase
MHTVFFTNTGAVRDHNEDALLCEMVFSNQDMDDVQVLELQGASNVVAVADGVGGEPGGAEAAEIILNALIPLKFKNFGEDSPDRLVEAIATGISEMGKISETYPELTGMATTVAGLWTDGDKALLFNCGDCRIYRLRHGYLELLTKDHSLVYELYLNGEITMDEILTHPLRNILTSSIRDKGDSPRVFLREISVLKGDSYFMCSDGVWETLSQNALEYILSSAPPLEAGKLLAEKLLMIGTRDNSSFAWLY